jgi:hypothetical protein
MEVGVGTHPPMFLTGLHLLFSPVAALSSCLRTFSTRHLCLLFSLLVSRHRLLWLCSNLSAIPPTTRRSHVLFPLISPLASLHFNVSRGLSCTLEGTANRSLMVA